jgi:hypothetical protein
MAHPMVANDTVSDGKFESPMIEFLNKPGTSWLDTDDLYGFNAKNVEVDFGCSGKFYNMYLDQATVNNEGDYCFKSVKYWVVDGLLAGNDDGPILGPGDPIIDAKRFTSERFTVNMFNPDPVNNYVSSTYMQLFTISALALVAAYQNFFGIASGSTIMVKSSLYVFGFIIVTVGYAMNWQGADQIGQNGSIWDDEQCDEDGEGDCRSFKAGFAFFFLQAIFGIIAGAYIIGGQFIAHNVLNEDPQGVACCACLPCCKSSGSGAEEIEMTETADESRDAVTGI